MSRRKRRDADRHILDSADWSATKTARVAVELADTMTATIRESAHLILETSEVGYRTGFFLDRRPFVSLAARRDNARQRLRDDHGVTDISAAILRRQFDCREIDTTAAMLAESDPFVVSPDILLLALAGSDSLTTDDIDMILSPDDLDADSGWFYLPAPVTIGAQTRFGDLRWLQWKTDGRAITVTGWQDTDPDSTLADLVGHDGGTVSPCLPVTTYVAGLSGVEYTDDERAALHERFTEHSAVERGIMRAINMIEGETDGFGESSSSSLAVSGPPAQATAKLCLVLLRLVNQKIATADAYRSGVRVGNARPRDYDDVRIVRLRATERKPSERDPGDGAARIYSHRWTVRMHKRRQFYPSDGRHQIVFVGPYVKGPEDAPFLPGRKVYGLIR